MKALRILGCIAIVTLIADPASSQPSTASTASQDVVSKKPLPSTAPAPLIGVGLPMVGAALLAFLLVRRFRQKD